MIQKTSRNLLSTKQLFAIFVITFAGRGMVGLTTISTKYAGRDGWIGVILAGIFSTITVNVILFLLQYFPNKTFTEMSEALLGKYLGKIPTILLFGYYLIFTTLNLRVAVDLSSTWLLVQTPIEILSISMLVLAIYLVCHGLKVTGRFTQAIVWILTPIIFVLIIPVVQHGKLMLLLPVLDTSISNIFRASVPSFYAFLGFESIFLLYSYVRQDTSHMEIVKITNFAMLIAFVLKVGIVASAIAVFGEIELQFFLYPVLEYAKMIVFPVIERFEFFMIYFWLLLLFTSFSTLFMITVKAAEQVIKKEKVKIIPFILAAVIYYLNKIPQDVSEVRRYVEWIGPMGFGITWFLLLLLLGVAVIRGRRRWS